MAKGVTSKSRNKDEENKRREEQQKPHSEQKQTTQKQKPGQSKPQNETPVESKPATQEVAPKPTSTQIPTLEPKYASPEQIEEARDFGRRSLEMARAGQLDMSEKIPFTQGVEGYAEQYRIPELEETPSTTMPSDNYASETRQDRTGRGYRPSPEDVSDYNKNPYKGEQRSAQSSEGPVDILGTRRPNSISEEGQRQVDKLSRRIASLQNTPMTGDAAIDEVTQRNNQEEIAKLQRQIDTIYNTDNSDNASNVERYLDPNYRLSKYEEQNAEQIFDEYLENNPKAKELYNTNDAAMSSLLAQRMTPEEAEEYARMVTLKNKTSDLGSAGLHMAQSMPFVRGLADKSMEAYEDQKGGGKKGEGSKGLDLSDYNYSAQLEQTQRQNPLASTAGNMAYQLPSYAAFAPLVEGIPVVGKAASALGGKFSNPAVAKAVESIVSGQAADTILDTLPNEIIPDLMEGNWRDLPKDIALNQLGNLAFNVLGEGAGALAKNFIPSLRNADEVADTVQQNELNPVDLARQNEIDVNAKVDNVNQAVDEVNNLAEQVPNISEESIDYETRKLLRERASEQRSANYSDDFDARTAADRRIAAIDRELQQKAPQLFDENGQLKDIPEELIEDNTIPQEIKDYVQKREDLINRTQAIFAEPMSPEEMAQTFRSVNAMDEYMSQKYPDLFDNGKFVGLDEAAQRFSRQIPEAPAQPIEQAVRNTPDVENSASNIIPTTTRENYVPHSRQGEAPAFDMPEYRADYSKGIAENVKSLEMPNDVRGYVDSKVKTLDDIFDRIDNAQTKDELDGLYKELNDTVKDLDDTLKDSAQARLIPKRTFDDNTKSFVNAIKGMTINVPDNVRAELPNQTLKQLEARLHFYGDGQNINVHLRKNSGIGIDSVFEDIDAATGHALSSFMEQNGLNPDVTENQLKGILEYADYLKETQNSTKVMDYTGGIFDDYVLEAKRRINARSQALFDARKATKSVSAPTAEAVPAMPDDIANFEAQRQQIFQEIDEATARGEDPSMYYGMLNDLEEDMRSAHPEMFDAKTSEYVGASRGSNNVSTPEVKPEPTEPNNVPVSGGNVPPQTPPNGGGNVPPNTPPNGGENPSGPNNNVIDLDQSANGDVFERGTSKHITADPYEFDPHNYNGSYTINNNGKIELTFKDMPDNATRRTLKQNGFKWDSNNKVWTAEATPENKSLARKISRTPTENGPTGSYTINNKKEIEISFGKAPNEQTIKEMKARGFKYDPRAKTWYAKDTAYRRELADSIMTGDPIPRKTGMMRMEGVSDEVVDTFRENPDMYNALRNEDTKALADAIYNSGDTTVRINNREYSGNAEAKFRELLREKNPASLPLGHQIAKDYSAAGNHDMAAQIYHEMGQALTESGQFSQAAIINMVKNDPMTALQYFQKQINSMNIEGAEKYGRRWKDFILTDEEKALFDNIKPGDEEAIKKAMDAVGARIEKEYPVTLLEQLLEFRRVAMLFNSRTLSRNFLANPPTAGMRYVADRIEAIGQNIAHLINPEIEVTQAILGSNRKTRGIAEQLWGSKKVQDMLKDTSGRLSEIPKVGDYVKNRQIFKGDPVSKWINRMTNGGVEKLNARLGKERAESLLEAWRNGTYKAMEITDRPLVRENFVSRLGSYIKAKGITDPSMVPDEAIMMAWEEAMKATYKDNSWLVDAIRKLKGGIESFGNGVKPGLGDIASQALIPYVQAPGNIGARVLDYSPVGLGKGIGKMWDGRRGLSNIIKGASRESYNPQLIQKGIEEFSKGASGTLLTGLGMMLYKSGLLTGGYSDDADEKAFQKQHGYREYARRDKINGETKYDTIDWAQPFSDVIIMGALLQEAIDKSDEYDSDILRHFGYEGTTAGRLIGTARESAGHAINAYFDATPLKNLGELFKGNYNGETDIAGNLWQNTVEDFASGLVPAQLNAIAKTTDSTQRQTYDPSNKFSTFVNTIEAKMPWSSNDLPVRYDTLGRPMTNGNSKAEAGFAKLLYPGEHTSDKSEAIDKEISRLFNATQEDRSVFPLVAPNSVNGEKLTAQEVSDYQGDMGTRTRKTCEALMQTDLYKSMEAVDQAELFKTIYGVSKAITERDLFGKEVSDTSTYKGAIAAYDKNGEDGLVNYLQGSALISSAGISSDSNAAKAIREAADKGDMEKAKMLSDSLSQLVSAGVSTKGQSAYATRGINYLGNIDPAEYSNLWNAINTDNLPDSPNDSVTQSEMLKYFNDNPKVFNNQTTAMQYWLGMLTDYDESKQVPYYDSSAREWKSHSRTGTEVTLINNLTESAKNGTLEIPVVEQQTAQAPQPQQTEESASSTRLEPIYLTPDPKQAVQQIEASGVPVNYLDSAWAKASAANPNLTAQDFTNTWSAIDSDGNGTHSTSEFINYLNRMGYNQKAAEPILEAYWHNNWHDPRYINGKWSY